MPPATKRRKVATKDETENKKLDKVKQLAGTTLWKTTTEHVDGYDLSKMSSYNKQTSIFTHAVHHNDAFTLKPLTITEGPLKGRQVFLLEPFKNFFRFMDLPTEIRLMIYEMLLQPASGTMHVGARRRKNGPTQPYRIEMTSEETTTFSVILAVSQQISAEAAPVLYSNCRIEFDTIPGCETFLKTIGSMRGYLRQIAINVRGDDKGKSRSVFSKLRDAKELRGIELDRTNMCGPDTALYWSRNAYVATVAADMKTLLTSLHKSRKASSGLPGVLDLVNITWEMCDHCKHGPEGQCWECRGEPAITCDEGQKCFEDRDVLHCSDRDAHCKEMKAKLRSAIAGVLGIEEGT